MAQLYFYYSAMNAGKSTLLLQSAHNYAEQGMNTLLFTADIDNRFGEGKIQSRIGLSKPAKLFEKKTNFRTTIEEYIKQTTIACVLVDEAQFLSREQVDQLARVVDELNIPVLCFGIRTDFQAESFNGSARLLAIADKLTELKTICNCGRKATMTVRLDDDGNVISEGEQVQIGGNERYESKCRKHYQELMDSANRKLKYTLQDEGNI